MTGGSFILILAVCVLILAAGIATRSRRQRRNVVRAEERRRRETAQAEERRQREAARAEEQRRLEAERAAERLRLEQEAKQSFPILERAVISLDPTEYLADSELSVWKAEHGPALQIAEKEHLASYLPDAEAVAFRLWCRQLHSLPQTVREINERFVDRRMAEELEAFDRVEDYPLTERQRRAIVTNEDTTLVIAGAGTGKTSTIVGKVDYIVRRRLAQPSQILVLAFAREASDDLKKRLARIRNLKSVNISTFHALGLRIVSEVEGKRPTLSRLAEGDRELRRFIRDRIQEMLASPEGQPLLVSFFGKYLDEEEPVAKAENGDELIRAQRARGLHALNGTKLKSREEVQIANWLTLNGITWEYERPYPIPTATLWHRDYQPDFYLPTYDLYIEHFGIDQNGNTAPHIDSHDYARAMQWKRALHRQHGTTLIETFSYFKDQGGLIARLEELLRQQGVEVLPLTQAEIDVITAEAKGPFSDFVNLIAQFLALYKGNGADQKTAQAKARSERDHVFLVIFRQLFEAYSAELESSGQIDFNDMINRAREYVRTGEFQARNSYILVDEFQDISENRLGLLQGLRAQQPHARLFVVGDDWQSIYRFTGSDVGIITHLAERVGATERVDLDFAFRYPQELLNLTSAFVMTNPSQLRKSLVANQENQSSLPVCVIFDVGRERTIDAPTPFELAFADIVEHAKGQRASVYILGRYKFNEPTISDNLQQMLKLRQITVEFKTAHASKGKEADYVIVVGLESGDYGFPANISDDPVMKMVLSDAEQYPYAEERRLFYVAMTRAKRRVYLIAPKDNASPFVERDILGKALSPYVETIGEISARHLCPKCRGTTIRRTRGQYGAFWGCSHFPLCHGKLDACPHCGEGGLESVRLENRLTAYRCTECQRTAETCPSCRRGYLLERSGRHGKFLGCSRWNGGAGCRYTRNI